jgi:hypothetical protein
MIFVHRSVIIAAGLFQVASSLLAAVQIRTQELPWAALGGAYDAQIVTVPDGRCPLADVGVSIVSGALPRGIELWGDRLQGMPREMGSFPFTIRAANGCQTAVTKDFVLIVTGKPILRVSPEELVFEYRVGGPLPRSQAILVASSWPHLPYSVTGEGSKWLNITMSEGFTPDRDAALSSDSVWVHVSPQGLQPGIHKSSVALTAWRGANAPMVPITLKVVAEQ